MAKTFVITSGKGGVGKSNIAVNIAVEFARNQLRTCLLDADLGLANVNLLLGIHPERTVDDVLFQDTPLDQVLIKTEHGVDVLPGSSGVEQLANLSGEQLSTLLTRFEGLKGYDFLLIDTGSGISRSVISFCLASEETLLVLTPENTSLADAYATVKVLALNGYQGIVRVVVNKCSSIPQAKKTFRHFNAVVKKYLKIDLRPGGAVLSDNQLAQAVSAQYPAVALMPKSMYALCIRALVANLLREGSREEVTNSTDDFWSRYGRVVGGDLVLPGGEGELVKEQPTDTQPESQEEGDSPSPKEERDNETDTPQVTAVSAPFSNLGLWERESLLGAVPFYGYILDEEFNGGVRGDQLATLVSHDPVSLARILAISSRRQGAAGDKSSDISHLIHESGAEVVHRQLVTTATHTLLGLRGSEAFLAGSQLWLHSVRCGLMAQSLAELVGYPAPKEVYVGGLLHDIGRIVLQSRFPYLYTNYLPHEHPKELLDKERERTGQTHADLGAELLRAWNVNSFIVDAARFHCEPYERVATALQMTRLICVAHRLSTPSEEHLAEGVEKAQELLHLSPAKIFTRIQKVSEEVARIRALYGVNALEDEDDVSRQLEDYRQKAVDLTTLQSVLATKNDTSEIGGIAHSIGRGLNLLFGLRRMICLVPNQRKNTLQAVRYDDGYGHEFADNVVFPLQSKGSRVVGAYHANELSFVLFDELTSMADRQLLRLMDTQTVLCLPLVNSQERTGMLLCGIGDREREHYELMKKRLELFGLHVARKMKAR